jgi:hypothetical protein
MTLNRITYLIICQIEHSIKLTKKLITLVKWPMGLNQMGHLTKLNKQNDMLGQNDQ